MGILYVSYAILLSILIFIESKKKKRPRWWPGAVLLFPPIVLVYILRTGKSLKFHFILLFFVTFSMVLGGEIFLQRSKKAPPLKETIPPILRKIILINDNVKESTIGLYDASAKLDSLGMVQSRITDIRSTIQQIEQIGQLAEDNQKAVDTLLQFIEDNQYFLDKQNLSWIGDIKEFYTNHHVTQHQKSRNHFLAAFDSLLTYMNTNFENIMEIKSKKHLSNYDAYYLRYRSAADSHNRFNRKRINFQAEFVEKHPKVKPFLPGTHQFEPFKFWDKFSF